MKLDVHDEAGGVIEAVADQYRKQLSDPTLSKAEVRVDIIRKLKLISDAIKGLMRGRQIPIDAFVPGADGHNGKNDESTE